MSTYNTNKQKEVHTIPSVFPSFWYFKDRRIQNSYMAPTQLLFYILSILDKHRVLNVVF